MGDLHWFYISTPWRELSYSLKLKAGGRCSHCGRVIADFKYLIGHHTVELNAENVHDSNISLNEKYIEIICHDCHNEEHNRFGSNKQQVYIVWGSPLSGKTTAVYELMRYGDMVVDIDELWAAITLQPKYVKPNNVRFNIFALQQSLIDQIKTRYGNWNNAYVITSSPSRNEVERLRDTLGAELITIQATKDMCIARAVESGRPKEWLEYIDNWFQSNDDTDQTSTPL